MLIYDTIEIGDRLMAFRKRAGLTQAELAEKAGLANRTYADIERGVSTMRVNTLLRLCEALRITPDDVLTIEDEKGRNDQDVMARLNEPVKICAVEKHPKS